MRIGRFIWRSALVGAGVLAAHGALRAAGTMPVAGRLDRTNFRGRTVSLTGGPALAATASVTAAIGAGSGRLAAAALLAGAASGAVGHYDDVVGARPDQKAAKGFRGHLSALRDGRVTSGMVKIAGVGAAALAACALADADAASALADTDGARTGRRPSRGLGRLINLTLGAGVVAGAANLLNLLDLRPGRALKAGILLGAPMLAGEGGGLLAGPVGAAAALLPADLDEQIMLGDTGANAFGALLGLGMIVRTGPLGRAGLLAGIAALTAASEKVSFTKVIAATPGLRELDALGRRTDHDGTGDQLRFVG